MIYHPRVLQLHTSKQLRAELEDMVLKDLLGPAGGGAVRAYDPKAMGQARKVLGSRITYCNRAAERIAQVQAGLEALPNIGAGNVVVTGTTGTGPFVVTFANSLANTNVPQMSGSASGGGAVTVTLSGVASMISFPGACHVAGAR